MTAESLKAIEISLGELQLKSATFQQLVDQVKAVQKFVEFAVIGFAPRIDESRLECYIFSHGAVACFYNECFFKGVGFFD